MQNVVVAEPYRFVLVLRAHYTMDVLAAITAAWCAWSLAGRICVGF